MTGAFRCSVASEGLPEPQAGSASTVPAFLLVEESGPWGVKAVRDSRLPDDVKQWLSRLEPEHRVRPLLIRRPARSDVATVRVFASYVRTDTPWLETAELADVRDVMRLDVTGMARGDSPGLTPYDGPLFLTCTHGRHDACCAERGRPLCRAFGSVAPDEAWEVSHIGGDRFAANVLVLPHGLYYGRLSPLDAELFVETHRAGRLDLAHLRGRCAYPFPVQAAEIYLREHLGLVSAEPFPLASHTRDGAVTAVDFVVAGQTWHVRVHSEIGTSRQLTCSAAAPGHALEHRLVSVQVDAH